MPLEVRGFKKTVPGASSLELRAEFLIQPSERVVLSGPSGSGKTTLFRFIAGLDPGRSATQGELRLAGRAVQHLPPEKREIGLVFQEPIVFPALSVLENAAFGLKVRGVGRDERRALVIPWLERVGLGSKLESDPDLLSGGEKQRLALVRAIAWEPKALLLDEPFSALDPALREDLGRLVLELHQKLTIPLLMVTHDPAEAERLGTRQIVCRVLSDVPRVHEWRG